MSSCLPTTLLWIFAVMLVQNVAYSLIAPFLTLRLVELGMNDIEMALIFSMYAVAVIIWSPILSSYLLPNHRPAKLIAYGMFFLGCSNALYGFAEAMPLGWAVVWCVLLRAVSGIASATV